MKYHLLNFWSYQINIDGLHKWFLWQWCHHGVLTLLSVTTTYSPVCVLYTAGLVIVCPCLTVQLPSGFWSETWCKKCRKRRVIKPIIFT